MHGVPLDLDDALRLAVLGLRDPARHPYDGLDALLRVCLDTVPGAEAAAISAAGHGRVHSTHVTDPAVVEVDAWHNRLADGPLLEAAVAGPPALTVLLVDDLVFEIADDDVLVRVTPPFRALHSTTLCSHDGRRTALDLYASDPEALGLDTTVLADMFARRATTLLHVPPEALATRHRLAVTLVGRALGLAGDEAEHLLLPYLHARSADPVAVAELLVDQLDGGGPGRAADDVGGGP